MLPTRLSSSSRLSLASLRHASTQVAVRSTPTHKIVVVGGGTAGVTVSAQLQRAFKAEGRTINDADIAIVDPAQLHHYQPGWTLAGSGLAELDQMAQPLQDVIPSGVKHYSTAVESFSPESNSIKTSDGSTISYDYLVVAPGLKSDFAKIPGLLEGLKDPNSGVSSIYHYDSVQKAWSNIKDFQKGAAIFTQPAGIIKCAGAPQKILWMALSQWKKDGKRDSVEPAFATGGPAMFAVPKYAKALDQLRVERNVEGLFSHNLVKIDNAKKTATFDVGAGRTVDKKFDLLHVVPPQGPPEFIKNSPLADAGGWVAVNAATTQHVKYPNIFSIGDASSLPNSKTAAAITAQAPVLVDNLRAHLDGKALPAAYDGYANCGIDFSVVSFISPLLTGHNELMLAEFKYGGVPKETFSKFPFFESQDKPNATFFWLKKNFFPRIYWSSFLKGTWFGPRGFLRPVAY
ncbi:BQ2448_5898 [Microbotryum intermedium]|uniref:Sulfide:quinone oxidoreductase, mitochondrial n=1 Tax=Microbotryum intermedium TaxID=269621 RepID=A0A238EZH0_9BASI|nr:BQ2448_5898 [Microbotryum intermedium]